MIDAPLRAVITTAHIAVPQLEFQRRRDLHIRAHLKHGLGSIAGRRDFERMHKPRLMMRRILSPLRTNPDLNILNFDVWGRRWRLPGLVRNHHVRFGIYRFFRGL